MNKHANAIALIRERIATLQKNQDSVRATIENCKGWMGGDVPTSLLQLGFDYCHEQMGLEVSVAFLERDGAKP